MGDIIYSYSQGIMTIVNKPRPRATYEVLLFILFCFVFVFVFFLIFFSPVLFVYLFFMGARGITG